MTEGYFVILSNLSFFFTIIISRFSVKFNERYKQKANIVSYGLNLENIWNTQLRFLASILL